MSLAKVGLKTRKPFENRYSLKKGQPLSTPSAASKVIDWKAGTVISYVHDWSSIQMSNQSINLRLCDGVQDIASIYLVSVLLVAKATGMKACQNCPANEASRMLRPFLPEKSGSSSTITLSKSPRPLFKSVRTATEFFPSTHVLLPRTKICTSGCHMR